MKEIMRYTGGHRTSPFAVLGGLNLKPVNFGGGVDGKNPQMSIPVQIYAGRFHITVLKILKQLILKRTYSEKNL